MSILRNIVEWKWHKEYPATRRSMSRSLAKHRIRPPIITTLESVDAYIYTSAFDRPITVIIQPSRHQDYSKFIAAVTWKRRSRIAGDDRRYQQAQVATREPATTTGVTIRTPNRPTPLPTYSAEAWDYEASLSSRALHGRRLHHLPTHRC